MVGCPLKKKKKKKKVGCTQKVKKQKREKQKSKKQWQNTSRSSPPSIFISRNLVICCLPGQKNKKCTRTLIHDQIIGGLKGLLSGNIDACCVCTNCEGIGEVLSSKYSRFYYFSFAKESNAKKSRG
jgi:hypothetical protein